MDVRIPAGKSNKPPKPDTFGMTAYGGEGWSPRLLEHRHELGSIWAACGIENEWAPLKSVLLHRPGSELAASADNYNAVQMLAPLDIGRAQAQHDQIAEAYRQQGVAVHYVRPDGAGNPNQMFCADLMVMTPHGAILARPASTVRAGEERWVARRLSDLGIPIIGIMTGSATFEGADLMWLSPSIVMIGRGLRTNQAAIDQITSMLSHHKVTVQAFDMPFGTMHFMGMVRIVGRDLAVAWPRRAPHGAVELLRANGYEVIFPPDLEELRQGHAFNIVTLRNRVILMAAANPNTQAFYASHGVECLTATVDELGKASGAVGCLTGILHRQSLTDDAEN